MVVETPLMWIDKAATWKLAEQLGGLDLVSMIRQETHTCYMGDHSTLHEWGYGCGNCPACELRRSGYERYRENRAGMKPLVQLTVATTGFESARRVEMLPEGHRCRSLHGHSFQATVFADFRGLGTVYPGGEVDALRQRLASVSRR